MFPHKEYHIYTTASGIEKRYVHLTIDQLAEARYLAEHIHSNLTNDWDTAYRLPVGDNIYLAVGDVYKPPTLQSRGYEGWESCVDGDFEEKVSFDSMIFHKCTERQSADWGPDWDAGAVRNWVQPEHRNEFSRQFEEYVDGTDRKV